MFTLPKDLHVRKKLEAILNIKRYQNGFWVPVMFFSVDQEMGSRKPFLHQKKVCIGKRGDELISSPDVPNP